MAYKKCKPLPGLSLLNELFAYNKKTGKVFRRKYTCGRAVKGVLVGTCDSKGHLQVYINGELYMLHRIVWKLQTGRDPLGELDHINGNKTDNKIKNLREVQIGDNNKNSPKPKNNTSGHIGVTFHKGVGKWQAQIVHKRKRIYLGLYKDIKDAIKARRNAEQEYGFHANHGR